MKLSLIGPLFLVALAASACTSLDESQSESASSAAELASTTEADIAARGARCECRSDVANWMVLLGRFDPSTGDLVEQIAYWSYGTGTTGPALAASHAAQVAKCEAKLAAHPRCQ